MWSKTKASPFLHSDEGASRPGRRLLAHTRVCPPTQPAQQHARTAQAPPMQIPTAPSAQTHLGQRGPGRTRWQRRRGWRRRRSSRGRRPALGPSHHTMCRGPRSEALSPSFALPPCHAPSRSPPVCPLSPCLHQVPAVRLRQQRREAGRLVLRQLLPLVLLRQLDALLPHRQVALDGPLFALCRWQAAAPVQTRRLHECGVFASPHCQAN